MVRETFSSYAPVEYNETNFMRNSTTIKIEGYEKRVFLKMTSSKVVTMNNVFLIPEIKKNLIYTTLIVKNELKYIFISNKITTSKSDIYLEKYWLNDGLVKFNIMVVDCNKMSTSLVT